MKILMCKYLIMYEKLAFLGKLFIDLIDNIGLIKFIHHLFCPNVNMKELQKDLN